MSFIYFTFFISDWKFLETDKTLQNDLTDILPLADKDQSLLCKCLLWEIGALNSEGACMWSGVEKFMSCRVDTRYRLEPSNVKRDT